MSNTELSGQNYEQVLSRSGKFFFYFLTESFCKYGSSVLYRRNSAGKQTYLNTGLFWIKQNPENRYILIEMEPGAQGKF
ncbi:hypothetical protein [Hominisplanchenecus sp.]|uniref:hypothetical protein n=1 Tax=Hominisplanchenecus sp. TaxID=3038130 RepID=UPI003994DD2C